MTNSNLYLEGNTSLHSSEKTRKYIA